MADILIKNMEMPNGCSWFDEEGKHHSCRFCLAYICSITGECIASSVERRHPTCPLIELPPHGKLIDADELLASDAIDWGEEAWNGINHAPVVLEAST